MSDQRVLEIGDDPAVYVVLNDVDLETTDWIKMDTVLRGAMYKTYEHLKDIAESGDEQAEEMRRDATFIIEVPLEKGATRKEGVSA